MTSTQVTIRYEGPALEQGRMDVKDLAPALLSLGKAIEESNNIIYKDKAQISVNVKTFRNGSFGIELELIQSVANTLKSYFLSSEIDAAVNIAGLLGLIKLSKDGLISLIKREGGRKPQKATTLEDGNIKIDYGDDDPIITTEEVFQLYQNRAVRKGVRQSLEPLKQKDINNFYSIYQDELQEHINKKEVDYFEEPEFDEQVVNEYEEEKIFSIVAISFKEDNKWRLDDGNKPIYVTISDKKFLNKVNKGQENFSKGDRLKVRLLTRQTEKADGLDTEYFVTEVKDHYKAARRLRLPLNG